MRGNGKIIQELEAAFRGAGWNVIKVIWGWQWDELLAKDKTGLLVKRMEECVDGDYQKYTVEPGSYTRKHFFGKYPELLQLVNHLTDEQIQKLLRGGHDARKMYAAYKAAVEHKGQPTVILAKTVKGYGLGEAGEGRNISHQQKKMNEKELREFRERFKIPISDDVIAETPFFRPPPDSPEIKYLMERRKALGGFLPERKVNPDTTKLDVPKLGLFCRIFQGLGHGGFHHDGVCAADNDSAPAQGHQQKHRAHHSRRGAHVRPRRAVPRNWDLFIQGTAVRAGGPGVVAVLSRGQGRTDSRGRHHRGRLDVVVHRGGHVLRHHGVPMVPFYIYYSMFGPQRVGDLFWLAGDIRAKGFLLGATSGRTTLNGEGLQHQDGHSLLLAGTVPTCLPYDPAFGYELAVIVADGLRRMYVENEDIFYYLSLYNENYLMPPMPAGVEDGILKGLYKFKAGPEGKKLKAQILGSGTIIKSALKAQEILAERYGVSADVWSATSYKLLRSDAIRCQRWNMLHPTVAPKKSYVEELAGEGAGAFHCRVRQRPDGARPDCAVGSGRIDDAGHGRLWPQRHPGAIAPVFRGGRGIHGHRHALRAG